MWFASCGGFRCECSAALQRAINTPEGGPSSDTAVHHDIAADEPAVGSEFDCGADIAGFDARCRQMTSSWRGVVPIPAQGKEKPHILRRGAFSTGGGAFRWPSGSTLVRIDGPPSFRAVHPPLLTGGPAAPSLQAHPTVRNIAVQAVVPQFEMAFL